jgi:hypothetical protein
VDRSISTCVLYAGAALRRVTELSNAAQNRLVMDVQQCCIMPPAFELRPRLAELARGGRRLELRYEWIKDWGRFKSIVEGDVWDLHDSEEWVILTLRDH